jgi:predicted RNA-binding protein with PUA domain
MAKVQVEFKDKQVTGEIIDFDVEKENWNVYKLEDGSKLKMRSVVAQIIRIENEYNPQGDPIYLVNSQNIVSADVPDHLKKKPPGKVN